MMSAPEFEAQGHPGVSTFMTVPGAYRLITIFESSLLLHPEALLCAQLCAGQGWGHSSDESPNPTLPGPRPSWGRCGEDPRGAPTQPGPGGLPGGDGDLRGCQ